MQTRGPRVHLRAKILESFALQTVRKARASYKVEATAKQFLNSASVWQMQDLNEPYEQQIAKDVLIL